MRPHPKRMTIEEFRPWADRQLGDERWELVDGYPLRMMAGGGRAHNVVASNLIINLAPAAKAKGCDATTSDTAVRINAHQLRLPDFVIDCDPPEDHVREAMAPRIIAEVLSPSTTAIDEMDKLDEYRSLSTARVLMLIDPLIVAVKVYRRDDDGTWMAERYDRLNQAVPLPEIDATLALSDIYDTLTPDERPSMRVVRAAD